MTEPMDDQDDVIVVGAGVIGLGIALELLARGQRVRIIERHKPGAGASSVAAGMLAPASEADLEETALISFALDSLQRYPAFIERVKRISGIDCGYRTEGTLWVACKRDDEAELEHLLRMQQKKGLSAHRLSAAEVLAREPLVSGRVLSGLFMEHDKQVDPRRLVAALTEAVQKLGGRIQCGCEVQRVDTHSQVEHLVTGCQSSGESFAWRCRTVVLTPGAWLTSGLTSGASNFVVRPVKGQIVRLQGPVLIRHIVRTPYVYLVPRHGGELLIGSTMEEKGFDAAPTAGAVMDLLRYAWEVLPSTSDLAISELSVGFRPALRDHLPIIDSTDEPGCFAAIGHFRNGVLLTPATAHYLAEMILLGTRPQPLVPFMTSRFAAKKAL